ncbi:MAG: dienelactone hydrolase family protein [Arenimonas sp.]
MSHWVSLQTPSGAISGWRADPAIPGHGALVVVQEIFGVNSHIRSVVDRLAAHGFTAIAPALFDHFEHHVELGYDEAGISRGRTLVEQLGFDRAVEDVHAVQQMLQPEGKVGVLGFCWGGTVAYLSWARLRLPAVSYYGARTLPFLAHERSSAPLMLHFGEQDPMLPPEAIAAHREALPDANIHTWPAGHGFNCDQRADYNAEVAAEAMQRSLAFLGTWLR